MSTNSALRSAGVVLVAAVVALIIWAVIRLLGVDLVVGKGQDPSHVGAVDVVVATVIVGLAASAVHLLLARRARSARWWPFVGSTAIAVSMIAPSYLADGAASVALMSMHVVVGVVLIWGFARFVARSPWAGYLTSDEARSRHARAAD